MDQEHRALRTLGAALAAAALLGGCAAPAWRPPPPAQPYPQVSSASPPAPTGTPPLQSPAQPAPAAPARPAYRLSPASRALITQARALQRRGDLDGASASLDRALRIEPNNPLLWIEIGRLRLAENDAPQAENCARKALALAGGDRSAHAQASRLLVEALRAQGRNREAVEVEQRR